MTPQYLYENLLELEPCLLHIAVKASSGKPRRDGRRPDYDAIEQMLRDGASYLQIHEATGASTSTIAKAARNANLMVGCGNYRSPTKRSLRRLTDAQKAALLAEYASEPYPTALEVARKHGVAESTARSYKAKALGRDY